MYALSVVYVAIGLGMAVLGIGIGTGRLRPYRMEISRGARQRLGFTSVLVAVAVLAVAGFVALEPTPPTILLTRICLAIGALSVGHLAVLGVSRKAVTTQVWPVGTTRDDRSRSLLRTL